MPLTNNENQELCKLLAKLEPGMLPSDVFVSIARLTVQPAIEFIPLRKNGKKIEVLLLPRSDDDPIWPGMLHTPGTILRPNDTEFKYPFKRLLDEEIGITGKYKLMFNTSGLFKSERGSGVSFEYILILEDDPKNGEYYDVLQLPDNLVSGQAEFIERSVARFKEPA